MRKSNDFVFNDDCHQAFDNLKSALTSYPVLRIYSPSAETQLHTDASSIALAAILLQRQDMNKWAPIAYYSQTTNESDC